MLTQLQHSTSYRSFYLLFILLLSSAKLSCQCNPQDRQSLLKFSASFVPSLNWSSASDCCMSWEGIGCDDRGRVTHLWLPFRGLRRNISSSLGSLSALTQLNLSHNSLSGSLPDRFFTSLSSLEVLDLSFNRLLGALSASFPDNSCFPPNIRAVDISSNQFYGVIEPSWFVSGSKLISFNASNNGFTGWIPSSICTSSPLLKTLDFSSNNFSGQIPIGLGRCSKLEVFRAGFNSLSGSLPADIYSLGSLVELSVPENNFSGTIGEGMVGLTNLRILDLHFNKFSGMIPRDIDKLFKLEQLVVNDNHLNGSLPPALMNCTNLVQLILRFNSLDSNISTLDFSKLNRLHSLDLGFNNFSGTLPESIYSCKSLTAIRVAGNRLTGQISPKMLALPSLSYLSLAFNNFSNVSEAIKILAVCKRLRVLFLTQNFYNEALPYEKSFLGPDGFKNLQILSLRGCKLRGEVPAWLVNMKKLQLLELSGNQITGTIPDWLGTLPSLSFFNLSHNLLTGKIPPQLSRLHALVSDKDATKLNQTDFELPIFDVIQKATYLQFNWMESLPSGIYINANNITGSIPVELSQLQYLQELDLSENLLSGSIPPEFSRLKNIEILNLSHNNLQGEIPASLQSLHFLSGFNVSYNDLEGPTPTEGQFGTFTEYSYIGNMGLCGQVLQKSCAHTSVPGTRHEEDGISKNNYKRLFLDGVAIGFSTFFTAVLAIMGFQLWKMLKNYKL
uniref:Leucine-rich repeat-containing N-terminal plant-type domain-containing protein n=1 Tax=Opuntia streptacantha TaxID=393608 RepID=A0A7C9APM1_OPUST